MLTNSTGPWLSEGIRFVHTLGEICEKQPVKLLLTYHNADFKVQFLENVTVKLTTLCVHILQDRGFQNVYDLIIPKRKLLRNNLSNLSHNMS